MVVFDGVVDDDDEEDDGTAEETIDKGVGYLVEPAFLIKRAIGADHVIEDEPADGDRGCSEPEALGKEQVAVNEDGFGEQVPAAEMKDDG